MLCITSIWNWTKIYETKKGLCGPEQVRHVPDVYSLQLFPKDNRLCKISIEKSLNFDSSSTILTQQLKKEEKLVISVLETL